MAVTQEARGTVAAEARLAADAIKFLSCIENKQIKKEKKPKLNHILKSNLHLSRKGSSKQKKDATSGEHGGVTCETKCSTGIVANREDELLINEPDNASVWESVRLPEVYLLLCETRVGAKK